MDALIYLTRSSEEVTFREVLKLDTSDNAALRYLMRRLDMTKEQVHIIACIIYETRGLGNTCYNTDLRKYLNLHPLEVSPDRGSFKQLIERGYVYAEWWGDKQKWSMGEGAMSALDNNKPFDKATLKLSDNLALLKKCASVIRKNVESKDKLLENLTGIFRLNDHLSIVRNITKIADGNNSIFLTLVYFAAILGLKKEYSVTQEDLERILDEYEADQIMSSLKYETSPLVTENILEPFHDRAGTAMPDYWVISKHGWLTLLDNNLQEVNNFFQSGSEEVTTNLTSCKQIKERKLFFSGKTEEEIKRLRNMLQEDQYRQVVDRLKEKNMPIGFNILLYGTPGTGKTELVQQLARETGRDIFSVDMSQIRDKWVGQSEQNLAHIFKTYQSYVSHMKVTPILFCNECDAIFGSRLEHTVDAVDKMENAMQNILLEQMEKMQGIMICTTNLTSTLDKAFERRFLFKLQLPKPGIEARKQIWKSMLPGLDEEQADILATRFDFSGGQIQNVTRKQIINGIFNGGEQMDFNRILDDCNAETMDRSNGHKIGFNG